MRTARLGLFFKENCDIPPTFLSFNYYYYFCKLTSVSYYIVPSSCYRALNQYRMKSRFAHGPVTSVPHSCNVRLVILQVNRSPVRFPRTCSTRRQIRELCFSDDLGPLFPFLGRPRAVNIQVVCGQILRRLACLLESRLLVITS